MLTNPGRRSRDRWRSLRAGPRRLPPAA